MLASLVGAPPHTTLYLMAIQTPSIPLSSLPSAAKLNRTREEERKEYERFEN
jgi:hypothetical protein